MVSPDGFASDGRGFLIATVVSPERATILCS